MATFEELAAAGKEYLKKLNINYTDKIREEIRKELEEEIRREEQARRDERRAQMDYYRRHLNRVNTSFNQADVFQMQRMIPTSWFDDPKPTPDDVEDVIE